MPSNGPEHPPLTPKEILAKLDEYIVGQAKAKRAVAVALRNRWRRRQLDEQLAADVYPKNILLIGPTGVGKTEIARRLAALAKAPFVKVEASKYSEVGYHGRDVESMIRDLAEAAVALVRQEHASSVREQAGQHAEERLHTALCRTRGITDFDGRSEFSAFAEPGEIWQAPPFAEDQTAEPDRADQSVLRAELLDQLRSGALEEDLVEIEIVDHSTPTLAITGPQGNDAMGIDTRALQELWGRNPATRTKISRFTISEAREILVEEEAEKLIDQDAIVREALERAENDGIVFLDEIDKVVGSGGSDGPDVSREGVQRDLLPVVEGCAVYTRYGPLRTDHVLFIAAGAFHFHTPSELIPELQGRFPVRVALRDLTEEDFVRILTEPRNSLVRQYQALFSTEGVKLRFAEDGVRRLAALSFRANQITQNIGARRLLTILEKCLEDLAFEASEMAGQDVTVDATLVDEVLGETADDDDLIQYKV